MGNACCKSSLQEAALVQNVYPKNEKDEIVVGQLNKLTMYALQNPDKLIFIGNTLENNVRRDLQKKKLNYVLIGTQALDAMVERCNSELSIFIVSVVNVVKILLEQDNVTLRIKAIETLTTAVQYLGEHKNNFAVFLGTLVSFFTFVVNTNAQDTYRLRITAMRSITRMISDRDKTSMFSQIFERLKEVIPALLMNILDPQQTNNEDDEIDKTITSLETLEFNVTSLTRSTMTLTLDHVKKTAMDCLAAIADATSYAHMKSLINPIVTYLDQRQAWKPTFFAKMVVKILLRSGFSQHGYMFASLFFQHMDTVQDIPTRVCIMDVVCYMYNKQSKKAVVGTRAAEAISSLIRYLIASADNESMKDFHRATIGAASAIAKRGQQSSQNLDIMGTILAMMKKTKSENEATSLLLVRLLCAVATFSTLAPVGKFYPDTFIRGLCEESLSQKPKARELVLQAFQTIAKVSEEEKAKPQQDSSNQNAAKSVAALSKKQIEDLYVHLFRNCMQLSDNQPSNYVAIFKTFVCFLNQYKSRDLEHSVPLMLRLEEVSVQLKDKAHSFSVQTLVAAYFYVLSQTYINKDLETYIAQIVTKRAEQRQISKQFLTIMANYQNSNDLHQLFVYDAYEPVSAESLLNKETIIELLCKIEILKTNYENVRNTFSDLYKGDLSNQSVSAKEDDADKFIFIGDDANTDTQMDNDQLDDEEEDTSKIQQIAQQDFVKLGDHAHSKQQTVQRKLEELLDAVPKQNMYLDDDVDILEEEEDMLVQHEDVSVLKIDIPQLYVFQMA